MKIIQKLKSFSKRFMKSPLAQNNDKFLSLTGLQTFLDKLKTVFASKSNVIESTLSNSGWTETDNNTFTNTILVEGVTPNTIVEVFVANDSSYDEKLAWINSGIFSGSILESNKVTVEGMGEIPLIDIPITIIVRGD